MATFGDVSTIRTFIDPFSSVFPSIAPYGHDKIILSESKHLAVLYDLNTCLPVKCWTFSELDPLVSPFIYDHVNEKFVAVKQNKVALFKCDSEDDQIQMKLGKYIHCLITNPSKESLVLFKNGFIKPLSWVIADKGKTIGPDVIPPNEEIRTTTINQLSPEISWIALLTKTQNCFNKLYVMKADLINGTGELNAKYTVKQSYKCLTITASGQPIGLTEDGNILSLQVEGEQHLLTLRQCSVISALSLPEDDALVVVVKEGQSYLLKIVNLKFKVTINQLALDITPLHDFISHSNGNIFIGSSKAMLCVQYEVKRASLASVMGKNFCSKSSTAKTTKRQAPAHVFLDSSSEIKLTSSPLNDNITPNELKTLLPQSDELLSEKAIFAALAMILKAKCFSLSDDTCREILDSLISRPFNHSYMVNVVRAANPTVEQFTQIIDILIESLSLDNGFIIDWLIVILDACLRLVLLSRTDAIKETLNKLRDRMQQMDEAMGKCREMSNLIDDLLIYKTKIPSSSVYIGVKHDKYCIEILEL